MYGDVVLGLIQLEMKISHLYRSNNPPTEEEAEIARAIVAAEEQEIAVFDEIKPHEPWLEAVRAQEELRLLHDKVEHIGSFTQSPKPATHEDFEIVRAASEKISLRLQASVRKAYLDVNHSLHKSVLSPLRRLPPELLAEIFRHSVQRRVFYTQNTNVYPVGMSHLPCELTHGMSQTCRYWRSVALDTPELWTDIPVVYSIYRGDAVPKYAYHVANFLERSKKLPIHVVVSVLNLQLSFPRLRDDSREAGEFNPLILAPLLASSTRWKSATLHINGYIFDSIPQLEFPLLERLNIRSFTGLPVVLYIFPEHILGSSPVIKEVVMDGQAAITNGAATLFPSMETFTGLLETLEPLRYAASSLKKCTFRGPVAKMALLDDADEPIDLPHLVSLSVANTNYGDGNPSFGKNGVTVFQGLKCPALEHLSVEGHPVINDANMIVDQVLTMLPAPSSLTTLVLHIAGLVELHVEQLLVIAPRLTSVDIWMPESFDWNLLTMLSSSTPKGMAIPLAPKLCNLTLRRAHIRDFTPFERIQDSRQTPEAQEQRLESRIMIKIIYKTAQAGNDAFNQACHWNDELLDPEKKLEYKKLRGWTVFIVKQFLERTRQRFVDFSRFPQWIRPLGRFAVPGLKTPNSQTRHSIWEFEPLDAFFRVVEAYEVAHPVALEASQLRQAMIALAEASRDFVMFPNPGYMAGSEGKDTFGVRASKVAAAWTALVERHVTPPRWIRSDDSLSISLIPTL